MKIKYTGGRSRMDISFNRKPYYFTPENNRVLDIEDKAVINYIFHLPNSAEFETVVEESPAKEEIKKENNLKCNVCEFIAKSEQGLIVHKSKKH